MTKRLQLLLPKGCNFSVPIGCNSLTKRLQLYDQKVTHLWPKCCNLSVPESCNSVTERLQLLDQKVATIWPKSCNLSVTKMLQLYMTKRLQPFGNRKVGTRYATRVATEVELKGWVDGFPIPRNSYFKISMQPGQASQPGWPLRPAGLVLGRRGDAFGTVWITGETGKVLF